MHMGMRTEAECFKGQIDAGSNPWHGTQCNWRHHLRCYKFLLRMIFVKWYPHWNARSRTAAAIVVDNDTNTALICRSLIPLCTGVGKWLQTLLSHPHWKTSGLGLERLTNINNMSKRKSHGIGMLEHNSLCQFVVYTEPTKGCLG